jgi:hypothetical protein
MRRTVYRMLGAAAVLTALVLLVIGSASAATITTFTPIQGSVDANGSIVTVTGSGFTNARNVFFNGVAASWFQVGSDTTIFARVPTGAATGFITVSAADGTTPSSAGLTITGTTNGQFQVLPSFNQPGTNAGLTPTAGTGGTTANPHAVIAAFLPRSGAAGTKVVIKGSNFKGAASVRFGGVGAATFKVVGSSITVTVPAHAKTGKITVTTGGGTTSSAGVFTVK